jgi:replicative DNA helicase
MAAERNTPFDHVPPQSLEMEQATLGAMLIERAAVEKAGEILKPEDFYRDAHRIIFEAILTLYERDEPVDILTVQEQLKSQGDLEAVGGTPYIIQLTEAVPTPASVEYYARIVEEKAILRRLIDASNQIRAMAHGEYSDVADVVDAAEKAIFAVAQRRMGAYFTPMQPLVASVFEQLEHRSEHKDQTTGLATPFDDLNYATAGFQPADLVIVAARPSMGKTSLAMGIAQHVAIRQKLPVAVFSLEMSKEQLCLRMICSEARVDGHSLRTGYLRDEDWRRVGEACSILSSAPIFIDDSPDISALEMRAKCRRLMAEHGLGLVVVDYLQLMRGQRRSDNRTQEIGEISRALKSLARELRVPVLALAQLSRAVEQRPDKRPMLSDLRESGSIEAEADLVIFIYRDAYYKMKEAVSAELDETEKEERRRRGEDKVEEAELIIAKQRNGPTGKVMVAFHPNYLRFDNLARIPGPI